MADLNVAAAPDFLARIGRLLADGDVSESIAAAERACAEHGTPDAVCALAAIAYRQGNLAAAIQLIEPLADGIQVSSDIPEALAVLNCLAGRVSEALFYGKLATVLKPDNAVLPLFGPTFPRYADAFLSIEQKPLLRRSREAFEAGDAVRATLLVEQHLQLFRDDVEGLDRYAECLMATGEYRKAVGVLRSVLTLAGPSATLFSRLGQSLVALGEFEQGMACHRQAVTRGGKAAVLWAAMVRDWSYCPWGETEAARQAAAGLAAVIAAGGPKVARKPPVAQVKPMLTVGFLCNAPRDEDHRAMVAAVAAGLKNSSVKVVGFGGGELIEASNVVYRGAFDLWRNTLKVDELTLSALVRGEGVDVLIDCDGLAARERLSLMARNPAPLQVSWLNMPLGVSMPGAHLHLGGEDGPACGMLLLPCAGANPTPLPAAAAAGGITFGADVTRAELTPEVVRVWAAILHAVPDATLVLANRSFDEPEAADRLVDLFGNFGVAHRIDIVGAASPEEFFTEVDVALAPFPVVRPAPYGLALSSGVPVVTLAGQDRTGFAKTLNALGGAVARMVVETEDEYVAAAVAACSDMDALAEFRHSMPLQLRQSQAFSPAAFAAEWERFFRTKLAGLAQGGV
ncbi:MAG: hypothetical protein ACM3Q1_04225 [Bacteroidales bacterium]